ncbi:MAG: hypothetical protein SGPRY_008310 [Prymnesium sp.]
MSVSRHTLLLRSSLVRYTRVGALGWQSFKSDQKLAFHNRWFCGPNAKRSAAQARTRINRRPGNDDWEEDDDDDDDDFDDSPPKGKAKAKAIEKKKGASNAIKAKATGSKANATGSKGGASSALKAKATGSNDKAGSKVGAGSSIAAKKGKGKEKGGGSKQANGSRRKGANHDDDDDNDDDDDDDDDDGGDGEGEKPLSYQAMKAKDKQKAFMAVMQSSVLHKVAWHRVVLDEAHAIKDRRCSTAQGAFALNANYRWCLSGTPLQNRVGELYSLVSFLRLDPYCYYFCKEAGCDCKCREYKFDAEWRACQYCGHSPFQHYSLFNRDIVNPIRKFGYLGAGRTGFIALKRGVLDKALLRRTKFQFLQAGRADEMVLPPKRITIEANFLDARESDFYNAIYTQSVAQFGAYVEEGTLLNNYAHILDLLTRLRQAINHPYLVIHSKREMGRGESEVVSTTDGATCGLCFEDAEDTVISACGHTFCRSCMQARPCYHQVD